MTVLCGSSSSGLGGGGGGGVTTRCLHVREEGVEVCQLGDLFFICVGVVNEIQLFLISDPPKAKL